MHLSDSYLRGLTGLLHTLRIVHLALLSTGSPQRVTGFLEASALYWRSGPCFTTFHLVVTHVRFVLYAVFASICGHPYCLGDVVGWCVVQRNRVKEAEALSLLALDA